MGIQYVHQETKKQIAKPAKHYNNVPSKIKQLLTFFQKFTQNIHAREQQLMDGKKDARKMIFTPLEKEEEQILWTMKC